MRPRGILLGAAFALSACTRPYLATRARWQTGAVLGDLQGRWEMVFALDSTARVPGATGGAARGILSVVVDPSQWTGTSFRSDAEIFIHMHFEYEQHAPCFTTEDSVRFVRLVDDSAYFSLTPFGNECGKITVVGRQVSDTFSGHWVQSGLVGWPPRGAFRMVRARPARGAA